MGVRTSILRPSLATVPDSGRAILKVPVVVIRTLLCTGGEIRHAIIVRLGQPFLFEHDFRTARPARTVYCHQEFLDKLTARRTEPVGKRTALLIKDGCGHRPATLQRNQWGQ